MKYLGIDIGGTSVKLAAVDQGRVLWSGQSAPYTRPDTQQLIQAIRYAAAGRTASADGVGLCAPGLLDETKRAVALSVNVPGLNGINLDALIFAALGTGLGQVTVVLDSIATAYDIWSQRHLAGRMLSLAIGTGIGAAVLDDGKPLHVDGESPGHFGQLDVSIAGHDVVGPDGGAGSLEGYFGAPALIKRFGGNLDSVLPTLRGDEAPFHALARAIRIAHAIYRPHHVVLAGGIGIRLAHALPKLRQLIETHLTNIARPAWILSTGDSDFHAAVGAAKLAAAGAA